MPQFEKYLQLNLGPTVAPGAFVQDIPQTELDLSVEESIRQDVISERLGVEQNQGLVIAQLVGRLHGLLEGNRAMAEGRVWVPDSISLLPRDPVTILDRKGFIFVVPGRTEVTLSKKGAGTNRNVLRAHHVGLVKNTVESPRATLRLPDSQLARTQRILIISGGTQPRSA